jgi:hypothetical protein
MVEGSPMKSLGGVFGPMLLLAGLLGAGHPVEAAATPQPATERTDDPLQLVVVITGWLGGADRLGAGIVVGEGGDRLYIATANHVVRQGGQTAEDLKVRFRALPGEGFEAKLLSDFDDKLDLAILSVAEVKRRGLTIPMLAFTRLGDPNALKRGSEVYALGHPSGKRWRVNVAPDRFARKAGDWLYFESTFLAPGYSGGALLNDRREIVGMLRGDQPPDGEALSIARIVESLRDWAYPVSLGQKPAVEIAGTWQGTVDYSGKGYIYREVFKFEVDGDQVSGIASLKKKFRRTLEGKINHDEITFVTRLPDSDYRYRGKISDNTIEFTVRIEGTGEETYWRTYRLVAERTTDSTRPALVSVPKGKCEGGERELRRLEGYDEVVESAWSYLFCAAGTKIVFRDSEGKAFTSYDFHEDGTIKKFAKDFQSKGLRCGEIGSNHQTVEVHQAIVILCQEAGKVVAVGLRLKPQYTGQDTKDPVVKWPE